MKKKLIAANWKMHKTPGETKEFFQALGSLLQTLEKNSTAATVDNIEVLVCPPALCLLTAIEAKSTMQFSLVNSKIAGQIHIGVQNVYAEAKGAFTGENSAEVAKSMGAGYALVGHSERRTLFGEGKDLLNKKMKYLQSLGLKSVLCIGETLAERDAGKTNLVLKTQLHEALEGVTPSADLVVAYEPVWAIGTGRVASTQQVAEAHQFCFQTLKELGYSADVRIQYGGGVKPDNAKELIQIPHVDGFLIGGASLEATSFAKIISECM